MTNRLCQIHRSATPVHGSLRLARPRITAAPRLCVEIGSFNGAPSARVSQAVDGSGGGAP